jgi:hypothetical protein
MEKYQKENGSEKQIVYRKRLLLYERKINGSMPCYESMRKSKIMWKF